MRTQEKDKKATRESKKVWSTIREEAGEAVREDLRTWSFSKRWAGKETMKNLRTWRTTRKKGREAITREEDGTSSPKEVIAGEEDFLT